MTNQYKKVIFILSLALLISFSSVTYAQIPNPLGSVSTFKQLFEKAIELIGEVLASLGTVMIIVSGILFLLSAGSPERVARAKSALTYALIALAIGLAAQFGAIGDFVKDLVPSGSSVTDIITNIAEKLGALIAGISAIMFTFAGIGYLFSFGDPAKMETAKKTLIYSVIGIIVGLAATAIVAFIKSIVT